MPSRIVEVIDGKKTCSVCKKNLLIICFHNLASTKCGLASCCKECSKAAKAQSKNKASKEHTALVNLKQQIRRRYGLTLEQYYQMIKDQDNKCAICGNPETAVDPRTNKVRALSVDHCHKTGKVRKLLCSACNNGLGCFRDNPKLTIKATNYLINYNETETSTNTTRD